jgi:hypothetical protein
MCAIYSKSPRYKTKFRTISYPGPKYGDPKISHFSNLDQIENQELPLDLE